jgi:hypothetical protein
MANNNISKYHGAVSECTCGIYRHPEKQGERACKQCFSRGFVAQCTACEGHGQVTEAMAGGPGTMKATCSACGGGGLFGVNKPEDWADEVKAEPETAVA